MRNIKRVTRRQFLRLVGLFGGGVCLSRAAEAVLRCSDYYLNRVRQCEAGISSSIAQQYINTRQFQSQWCWAACISMVFGYYGHPVSQQRIVERVFGSSFVNAAATPAQIIAAINVVWEDDNGNLFLPQGQQILTYDVNRNNILAAQLLSQNIPIIIGSLGHATVLTAMSWVEDIYGNYIINSFTVRDPMQGRRELTHIEVAFAHFMAVISVVA